MSKFEILVLKALWILIMRKFAEVDSDDIDELTNEIGVIIRKDAEKNREWPWKE